MKLVIKIITFGVFLMVMFHYPPDRVSAQPPDVIKVSKVDSLQMIKDSLKDKLSIYVDVMEKAQSDYPGKVERLKESLAILVAQKKDKSTQSSPEIRTKYVAVPAKSDYFAEQRRYADSMAVLRKDSIKEAWEHRSFFRKLLGLKPRKHNK